MKKKMMKQVENEHEEVVSNLEVALGLAVKRIRKRCDMTQNALAKAAGVSQSWVSLTENAHRHNRNKNPSIGIHQKIALALGLPRLSALIQIAEQIIEKSET